MRTSAFIRLRSDRLGMDFEWLDFNGDDCFDDFHINVITETGTTRFDFGGCAVSGLRKVGRFFRDNSQTTAGGGFRNPDIRYYDLHRNEDGYSLIVRFEGSGIREEFHITNPRLEIDDEFMRTVYSR